jgi:pyruvate formate lyase activating enzyme
MSEAAKAVCETCPRHCRLAEGAVGYCRARKAQGGRVVSANYGMATSLALDPIEKKPLSFFHPGSYILSIGSFGCNLRCPFCQNDSISQRGEGGVPVEHITPAQLAEVALRLKDERGNIGVAYTYNEPLVGWEFVRDAAREVRARGLVNVIVSNGCVEVAVIDELAPLIDAANIDLKGPSQKYYDWLGGNFDAVCRAIQTLHARGCHVEVTTLVVPGKNDREEDMDAIAAFIASVSPEIPLHVTRFYPRFQMTDTPPTSAATILRLAAVARRHLKKVL